MTVPGSATWWGAAVAACQVVELRFDLATAQPRAWTAVPLTCVVESDVVWSQQLGEREGERRSAGTVALTITLT